MRITIERLRTWIIVAGAVLVIAIVSFLAYARYKLHEFGKDLPQKLGLEIQQSTNGFTVSRSHAGHTQFVLHASKAVQYKNGGHLVLHDVSILLYGKDGTRADHVSGNEFNYDQTTGVAQAVGDVEIDMASPVAPAVPHAAKSPMPAKSPVAKMTASTVHVKTSNLIFNQKTQVATTDQPLTFSDGESSGSARGATYDSAAGTLELANDVALKSDMNGDPVTVKAESANFNRDIKQLVLIKSYSEYQGSHGTADQSTVYFREDGSADHVLAQGTVHVISDSGDDLHAGSALAQLDSQSHLMNIHLDGGVLLIAKKDGDNGPQTFHADSNTGVMTFRNNALRHMQLVQAVSVVDEQEGLQGDAHGSETREMRAGKLDVDFAPDDKGKAEAKNALASGEASVTVHTIHASAPQQSTTLKGDQLFATLVGGHQLSTLRGTGHTYLLQSNEGGRSQTGSADTLMVNFAPHTAGAKSPRNDGAPLAMPGSATGNQIASATQQGHASLAQLQPSTTPGAPPVKSTAMADKITYDGATGRIDLTGGSPRVEQGDSQVAAAALQFNRFSGDGSATGGVKATYSQAKGDGADGEPMHVVADHAAFDHDKDETTFFGSANGSARLWEGANSITAPVIVASRTKQLLTAKGPSGSVKAVFMSNGSNKTGVKASGPSVMRITSSSLVYSEGERKATFEGGVVALDTNETLHAASLQIYLASELVAKGGNAPVKTSEAGKSANNAFTGPAGQVDHVIATGHVEVQEGVRRGTGEKLVYTEQDQKFVLTGTATSLPRVTDPVHGTVTGASLIFNNRDDSVIVGKGQSATVTDTRTTK
jgi:lipopolysaccharide export system protein LptA